MLMMLMTMMTMMMAITLIKFDSLQIGRREVALPTTSLPDQTWQSLHSTFHCFAQCNAAHITTNKQTWQYCTTRFKELECLASFNTLTNFVSVNIDCTARSTESTKKSNIENNSNNLSAFSLLQILRVEQAF